jgi:hypothetical protein
LVKEAAKLFFATLFSRPEYVSKLVAYPTFESLLHLVLLDTQEHLIRRFSISFHFLSFSFIFFHFLSFSFIFFHFLSFSFIFFHFLSFSLFISFPSFHINSSPIYSEMSSGFKELILNSCHLGENAAPFLNKFLPTVFGFVFTLPTQCPQSDAFFEMIQEIIRGSFTTRKSLNSNGEQSLTQSRSFELADYVPLEEFLFRVVDMALVHPCLEESSESLPDEKLVGLIGIIEVICLNLPQYSEEIGPIEKKGLVYELFYSFLFELPTPSVQLGQSKVCFCVFGEEFLNLNCMNAYD